VAAPDTATTLPWSWYTDPEVLRLEEKRIFRRSWQYVGHTREVSEAESFRAIRSAPVPVLLTRDGEGTLRAFLNVCRHRGSLLLDGAGRRRTLQCGYHAWTYGLDGRLLSAPRSERESGVELDELGLVPLGIETWGPFVFVNPDRDAPPLSDLLGDLPGRLAAAGIDLDALSFHSRAESELAANWKVCAENYLECYHCPVAHPGFSAAVDVTPEAYEVEAVGSRASQYGPLRTEPAGPFDTSGEIERGQFHFVFPNTVVNVMPGRPNLSIGPIMPLAPERTYRFLDYFFAPDADTSWIEELLAFDGQVGAEDARLVERVQVGVRSGLLEEGRLLPESERLVAHFQSQVVQTLA
jgi:phenylpropionate dioxygenase-like ring-hydroxylating dioxygenase large terminal subunit